MQNTQGRIQMNERIVVKIGSSSLTSEKAA